MWNRSLSVLVEIGVGDCGFLESRLLVCTTAAFNPLNPHYGSLIWSEHVSLGYD